MYAAERTQLQNGCKVFRVFGKLLSFACVTNGGEGGIRTHGTVSRTLAFEASTFNHSVTSPQWSVPLV
jgi:hypothetical protein